MRESVVRLEGRQGSLEMQRDASLLHLIAIFAIEIFALDFGALLFFLV